MAKKSAKWAKNSSDYAKKQAEKWKGKKSPKMNAEDVEVVKSKGKRIRDYGQKPPPGYRRTGGLYFAKQKYDRPIRTLTTDKQRALFYANQPKFIGVEMGNGKYKDGYIGQAANQGMYDGETSEVNFRKSANARKLIDAGGGTYYPGYGEDAHGTAGKKKRQKSRYIMAIGQDGHKR